MAASGILGLSQRLRETSCCGEDVDERMFHTMWTCVTALDQSLVLCTGDAQLAFELQQQEVERARAAATSNRPSGGHSTDSFAAMTGLSPLAPSQPTPQQPPHRPTNNPFAPDRRMPWAVAPGASQPPGASSMGATSPQGAGASSASSQDPFALLPPLYAQPAAPAQPPVQPPTGRFPSVQYPAPARPPQQLPPQAAYQPSWQASFPEPWANGVNPNRAAQPPPQHTSASLAADEALARALQQQLDMEVSDVIVVTVCALQICQCAAKNFLFLEDNHVVGSMSGFRA